MATSYVRVKASTRGLWKENLGRSNIRYGTADSLTALLLLCSLCSWFIYMCLWVCVCVCVCGYTNGELELSSLAYVLSLFADNVSRVDIFIRRQRLRRRPTSHYLRRQPPTIFFSYVSLFFSFFFLFRFNRFECGHWRNHFFFALWKFYFCKKRFLCLV